MLFQDSMRSNGELQGETQANLGTLIRDNLKRLFGSQTFDYYQRMAEKMIGEIHIDEERMKKSNSIDEVIDRLGVEMATFPFNGVNETFGVAYLGRFVKKGIVVSEEELKKYSLRQLHIRSWQDNPNGYIGGIYLDCKFGMVLEYVGSPIAVIGFSPTVFSDGGIEIHQIQGGVNYYREPIKAHLDRFKWTHALVCYMLDWSNEMGVGSVTIPSIKNNRWAKSTFSQLVELGFPITEFEKAMRMDPDKQRELVHKTLEERKEWISDYSRMFLPADGFMTYDITARRIKWKGGKFVQDQRGNYRMELR